MMKTKKVKEGPRNLLKELCGTDSALYDYLSRNLYETPMTAISKKDLDTLTQEGEQTGNFGPAIDRAIFENAQNSGEEEKYMSIVQNLSAKAIEAAERKKANQQEQGITGRAALLDQRIELQRFLNERAKDILAVSTEFYTEKLLGLGEIAEKKERDLTNSRAETHEQILAKREESGRKQRKRELRRMGRKERKEAKKQDNLEVLAAEQRKVVREQDRQTAREEALKIEEVEKKERNVRREKRMGT
jgi:hypothetical protein